MRLPRLGAFVVLAVLSACPPARPGPGGAERYVASNDGTAVLWIPEGATTADNITVARKASDDKLVYELLPDGLELAKPAVLFARTPAIAHDAANPDDPPGLSVLEGAVVSSNGTSEDVLTVRAGLAGTEGRQHGLSAMLVPHFTSATFGAYGVTGIFASLTDDDRPGFRRDLNEAWSAKFFIKANQIPNGEFTAQAAEALELQSPAAAGPTVFGSLFGSGTFAIPVRCKTAGPGFLRVQLKMRDKPSLVTFALRGVCAPPEFAAALEGAQAQFGIDDDQALIELVNQLIDPLPEPKPTPPAQPLKDLAPPKQQSSNFKLTLTLPCVVCQRGPTYTGLFRVTNDSTIASGNSQVLVASSVDAVRILSPITKAAKLGPGEGVDFEFRYECTETGTGVMLPFVEHFAPIDPEDPRSSPIARDNFRAPDGNPVFVKCVDREEAPRAGMSDVFPVTRDSAGSSWALGAASAFVDVCSPTADSYPVGPNTVVSRDSSGCTSAPGPSPLQLSSGAQTVTATQNTTTGVYGVTGATQGPALLATDTVQVTPPGGGPVSAVAPPQPTNPNLFLSTPNGWKTLIRVPDGTANTLRVSAQFETPSGARPGNYQLSRVVPMSELPLVNGSRETPVLPPEAEEQIVRSGWVPQLIKIEFSNQVASSSFTPWGSTSVFAGRSFSLNASALSGTGGGTGGGGGTATGGGGGTATGGGGGTATGGGGGTATGGGGGSATGGGTGGGGGSTTFITLTPDPGAVSAELATRLGENHAGSIQQRFTGSASVTSSSANVVVFDNPTGGTTKIVGVLATFAAGSAEGALSNSKQATTRFVSGPHVASGERWALVTRVDAGQRLTLERWFTSTGPLEATSLELVVLGDYNPQFTVAAGAWLKLCENRGPDIWNYGVLFMTMSPGGTDPAMLTRSCPNGFNCATPGPVGRNTLPATAGLGLPLDDVYEVSAIDRMGGAPLTATFTMYLEVPPTGPFRIIWNRL